MNDLHGMPDFFESFRQGRPEGFRYYFHIHNYRIYCYLLRLSRDPGHARELTQHAFIVLFRNAGWVKDEEHLLRRLYLHARVAYRLLLAGKGSSGDLETELAFYNEENGDILDDPDIARNETLIAVQAAMQKLPPGKREVAELYFFQGLPISAIARQLGLDEESVRQYISQSMKRLGEELTRNRIDKNKLSMVRG